MAKFTAYVAMVGPDMKPVAFKPGDEVPEWADVGDHVTDGKNEPKRASRTRKDDIKDQAEKA